MIRLEGVAYEAPRPPDASAPSFRMGPVDFSAPSGTSHLLLGRNGCGKTTLIRMLSGLVPPTEGRYLLAGREVRVGPEGRSLWPEVAVLFEEPDPQFLTDRVEAEIAFGIESLGASPEEIRERTSAALGEFGLMGVAERAPQSLSAGEKARTLLAAAHAARPRCLLLDQALSHLDPGTRRDLELRLVREALTLERVVVRSHQEADPPLPGETLHVLDGATLRPVSHWTPKAVSDAVHVPFPLALRVSALLAQQGRWSGPLVAQAEGIEALLDREREGTAHGGERAGARLGGPRERAVEAVSRAAEHAAAEGTVALAMSGVGWDAPGEGRVPVVSKLDFALRRGEIVAVIGRSGAGKTTVLKLAAGLLEPARGTIHRERPPVSRVRRTALALEYPERQLFGRTVLEDVGALLWVEGVPREERARSARRAMEDVGLEPGRFEERSPISLSEGEKRRVALAGVIVEPPHILLLDEPTAGLDPSGRRALMDVLRRLRERGRTVLLASHDLDFVASVSDRVLALAGRGGSGGTLAGQGPAGEILRDPRLMSEIGIPEPDFVRLERLLVAERLIGPADVRDPESLLDALARGGGSARPVGSSTRPGA